MKLLREFFCLPLLFDAERLRREVGALPAEAWASHPTDYPGNSSVRLISVDGGENDQVKGPMLSTPHLARMPYVQQVLASFGVVWSRSRLMRLAPGASVPQHADINYHWFHRVRVHIPIVTRPEVAFHCGDKRVHMAAGEVWIFDNWRLHRVENPTPDQRIHLVADTCGSRAFWQMVAVGAAAPAPQRVPYQEGANATLLTERHNRYVVMPPGEVEILMSDLCGELEPLAADGASRQVQAQMLDLARGFCRDWRALWSLYGDSEAGWVEFAALRDLLRQQAAPLLPGLIMRTNRNPARAVLEGRILQHALDPPTGWASMEPAAVQARQAVFGAPAGSRQLCRRPVIIVAAPRSGSTLLFETLACAEGLYTVGGEAHQMFEGLEEFRPGAADVESNRLSERHYSEHLGRHVDTYLTSELRDAGGRRWDGRTPIRMLEKTPKNALRVPLLNRLFPDALFVYLWRDPRENVSSIMEAWRSGRWVTYPRLKGWEGPWSLLLPPDWRKLRGASLAQIAAEQWRATNELVMDDLGRLPRDRWISLSYAELLARPDAVVRGVCDFAGLAVGELLARRLSGSLPEARYTLTPPRPDKWKLNQAEIELVFATVADCWERIRHCAAAAHFITPSNSSSGPR